MGRLIVVLLQVWLLLGLLAPFGYAALVGYGLYVHGEQLRAEEAKANDPLGIF